jgi:hypothetical protein
MNLRLSSIPALAVFLFAAVPALAQYPSRNAQPTSPAPLPAPPQQQQTQTTNPAPTPAPSAQTPSAPVALPTIAPPNCPQPVYPGGNASNTKIIAFNQDYKTYGDCVKKYVDENRAWITAVVEINNKAVEEYNRFTTELKKTLDAQKD